MIVEDCHLREHMGPNKRFKVYSQRKSLKNVNCMKKISYGNILLCAKGARSQAIHLPSSLIVKIHTNAQISRNDCYLEYL